MTRTKICTRCRAEKPLPDFNQALSQDDGLQPNCRMCQKELAKERSDKNRAKWEKTSPYTGEPRDA